MTTVGRIRISESAGRRAALALAGLGLLAVATTNAAVSLRGEVFGGGAPIAGSTVTLWAASAAVPKEIAHARTGADGHFSVNAPVQGKDTSLYLIAKGGTSSANKAAGDNPAIALIAVLGGTPPATVTINEMTTVASVWTHNQFIDGTAIRGNPLGLKIAAGNVPNFVNLATGGWGDAIQGSLNGPQTPTMANFATLADALAGCATRVTADACGKLFAAATGPTGATPTDTLAAAQSVARYPWYQPERLYALLEAFYPIPQGKNLRPVPYFPYLKWSPSAWVLPLKFDGGGYHAGGKGDVRQRRQLLGRRQLFRWLAGPGFAVGRARHQVRSQWQAAIAQYDGIHRRRDGRRHVWRSGRRQR